MRTKILECFFAVCCQFFEEHVRFREEHRFFRQTYGGCTIFSQKHCDGEQKLFMRVDRHNNAHNGIRVVFADWRTKTFYEN